MRSRNRDSVKSEKSRSSFVLCMRNGGAEDLETRKVYELLRDPPAAEEVYARVIDESGEDYLYSVDYFVPDLKCSAARRKRATTRSLPSTSMTSNKLGATAWPVSATRVALINSPAFTP